MNDENLSNDNNNDENILSVKDKYIMFISYLLIATILSNVSSEIILNISEQIALNENISKEHFISTFDNHHIQDIINDVIDGYGSMAIDILKEITKQQITNNL